MGEEQDGKGNLEKARREGRARSRPQHPWAGSLALRGTVS